MTVHRFLSTIFYLQYFHCYILRYNNLIAIYTLLYLCFFKPLLEGSLLSQEDTTQEIRLQYLSTISQDDVNGLPYTPS